MTIIDFKSALDRFISTTKQPIVIWGAGVCGRHCYDWLSRYGLQHLVKAFIDSNANKVGNLVNGITVIAKESLKEYHDAIIIIATQFHFQVYASLQKSQVSNSVFFFEDRLPAYYQEETYFHDSKELMQQYRNDTQTVCMLDLFSLLCRYHFGGVFSYSIVEHVPRFFEYWDSDETSLSRYEKITVVDVGAFTGDTVENLNLQYAKQLHRIYAFEPDPNNFNILQQTIKRLKMDNQVASYCAGLSNERQTLSFGGCNENASVLRSGGTEISVYPLDDLQIIPEGKLCIKMDVEGSELSALRGAEKTIKIFRPELAICVYHKYDDIIDVPSYIQSVVPEYHCILRCGSHMECYASVDRF